MLRLLRFAQDDTFSARDDNAPYCLHTPSGSGFGWSTTIR
jgi:hypothetical protein